MKTFLQFCRNCYLVKAHIAHETCSNARSMLKTLVYKRVTERKGWSCYEREDYEEM